MNPPRPPTLDPRPRRGRGHGGRRPGAGAPRGNINGLKHGRYSRAYQTVIAALMASPELDAIFRKIARARSRGPSRSAGASAVRRARRPKNPRGELNQDNQPPTNL